MKHALIVASVGILTSTVWVAAANAQANINQPGPSGASQARWDWYAAPGPTKRGNNMCVTNVDATRGYGFQQPCPAPKAAASASTRALSARAAAPAAASASTRALSARAAAPTRKHKVVSR